MNNSTPNAHGFKRPSKRCTGDLRRLARSRAGAFERGIRPGRDLATAQQQLATLAKRLHQANGRVVQTGAVMPPPAPIQIAQRLKQRVAQGLVWSRARTPGPHSRACERACALILGMPARFGQFSGFHHWPRSSSLAAKQQRHSRPGALRRGDRQRRESRAMSAPDLQPAMTLSAISRRLPASSFLRWPPTRPAARDGVSVIGRGTGTGVGVIGSNIDGRGRR